MARVRKPKPMVRKLLCDVRNESDGAPGWGNGCTIRGCVVGETTFLHGHEVCDYHGERIRNGETVQEEEGQ